jgi:hypothetical protein
VQLADDSQWAGWAVRETGGLALLLFLACVRGMRKFSWAQLRWAEDQIWGDGTLKGRLSPVIKLCHHMKPTHAPHDR